MEGEQMIVKLGQKFSFGVTYDSPSLFVRAEIYDDSGVSPVLLATVPMASFAGNSYKASYTPLAVMPLLIQMAVFTDGTYTTRDDQYYETDRSLQVVDFTFTPTINVAVADSSEALILLEEIDDTLLLVAIEDETLMLLMEC